MEGHVKGNVLRTLGKQPEERPRELHPALFRRHLQRHGNRLLPLGADAQPQPPAGRQPITGRPPGRAAFISSHLQRISEFMQALRS